MDRRAFLAALFAPFLRKLFPYRFGAAKKAAWYISQSGKFQFGFTGFKECQMSIGTTGQFLYGGNLMVLNPRSSFRLSPSLLHKSVF